MSATKKLREKYETFELNQSLKSVSPMIIETLITTFEFDGESSSARTKQKIVALGEGKTFKDAKNDSLKNALELLGVA